MVDRHTRMSTVTGKIDIDHVQRHPLSHQKTVLTLQATASENSNHLIALPSGSIPAHTASSHAHPTRQSDTPSAHTRSSQQSRRTWLGGRGLRSSSPFTGHRADTFCTKGRGLRGLVSRCALSTCFGMTVGVVWTSRHGRHPVGGQHSYLRSCAYARSEREPPSSRYDCIDRLLLIGVLL